MNITGKQIKEIVKNYKTLKSFNLHISDEDSISEMRRKDMNFGKLMAYEKILEILEIEV